MRYRIAHGYGVVHYSQITPNQVFSSGQPVVEEPETFQEYINRLEELGVDTSEIEKLENSN